MTITNYITYTVPSLVSVVLITAIVLLICWRWRSRSRQEEDDSKRDSNPLYGVYYMGEERFGEAWVVDWVTISRTTINRTTDSLELQIH